MNQGTKIRILVDLDVVTLSIWDRKDEVKLLESIKGGKFEMITPYILLEHLSRWDHKRLAEQISGFYEKYSSQIIIAQNLLDKTEEAQIEYGTLFSELVKIGVKEEDVVLVIIASIFDIDYLITYNRKHLKSKEKEINNVLRNHEIKGIRIILPSEL